ncbi:MAG: hypothetical protein IPM98_15845 [Lewinellaceae bacterium]|nr:hypothetical protein [Lewinellaceae bacterium]
MDALILDSKGKTESNGTERSLTTGFILKDDDPGDAFRWTSAWIPYKTPIFKTKIGHRPAREPGTAHREGCLMSLRDGSGSIAQRRTGQ